MLVQFTYRPVLSSFAMNDNKSKTRFTRMCIAEAIIDLLKKDDFNHIKISDVVKRAGVARMTFYKYYDSCFSALKDYLGIIISDYLEASHNHFENEYYMETEHIAFALEFFDQYADFFLILKRKGLYSLMIDGVNEFMKEHVMEERKLTLYELYSYAGGLLNSFLMWEENGKVESALAVAKVLSH